MPDFSQLTKFGRGSGYFPEYTTTFFHGNYFEHNSAATNEHPLEMVSQTRNDTIEYLHSVLMSEYE